MLIIEIKALENGAHRSQMSNFLTDAPKGWIEVPEELEAEAISYLPFIVLKINDAGELVGVAQGEIPEVEPEPDVPNPEERLVALEEENARMKAQIAAQSDQMDFYEECIVEMAAAVYA